jgi:hypothetical protein
MVKAGRHADPANAVNDVTGSPWRIRQQHDALTRLDQGAKAFEGTRKRGDTVMDDPPKVDNYSVVARRQRCDPANQPISHRAPQIR